jgi:hypothetical protein
LAGNTLRLAAANPLDGAQDELLPRLWHSDVLIAGMRH